MMNRQQALIFENPLYQLRLSFTRSLAIVALCAAAIRFFAQFVIYEGPLEPSAILGITLLSVAALVALLLAQSNRMRLASILVVTTLALMVWISELNYVIMVMSILALISAAVLTSSPVFVIVNGVIFAKHIIGITVIVRDLGWQPDPALISAVATMIALLLVSVLTRFFIAVAERIAQGSIRTTELLRATASLGQLISKMLSLEELLARSVELIQERFAFYHVQVFLVDEKREFARLVASTGEVGQRLLSRQHKLAVGSTSVIGRVTQVGEPVIARNTDRDPVHATNELLPNTRSELALPITDGDRIIGALDVQSTRRDPFSPTDVQALQVMANQLGVSIRNARLFEEQINSVSQNQRLRAEAEASLREIERLNSQLTRSMWESYLAEHPDAPAITLSADTLVPGADWTPSMRESQQTSAPVVRREGKTLVVAVPIMLRGQSLGAIEIATEARSEADALEIGQAVAERLATTLDTIRLYDEAQAAATQEQRINTVVSRYQSATSIEDLLQITLLELNQTLAAETGMIRLGLIPDEPASGSTDRSNGDHPAQSNGRTVHD